MSSRSTLVSQPRATIQRHERQNYWFKVVVVVIIMTSEWALVKGGRRKYDSSFHPSCPSVSLPPHPPTRGVVLFGLLSAWLDPKTPFDRHWFRASRVFQKRASRKSFRRRRRVRTPATPTSWRTRGETPPPSSRRPASVDATVFWRFCSKSVRRVVHRNLSRSRTRSNVRCPSNASSNSTSTLKGFAYRYVRMKVDRCDGESSVSLPLETERVAFQRSQWRWVVPNVHPPLSVKSVARVNYSVSTAARPRPTKTPSSTAFGRASRERSHTLPLLPPSHTFFNEVTQAAPPLVPDPSPSHFRRQRRNSTFARLSIESDTKLASIICVYFDYTQWLII